MLAKLPQLRPILTLPRASTRRAATASVAAAASLGLAACGGSGGTSTAAKSTAAPAPTAAVAVAQAPSATTGSETTTTTVSQTKTSTRAAVAVGSAHKAPAKAFTGADAAAAARSQLPSSSVKGSGAKVADDPPIQCMFNAGLTYARGPIHGIWEASKDPAYPESSSLYIDGPYKSTKAADQSASTLTPVDHAERGGLYVVSATLASHGTPVHQVAQCLDGPGGSKSKPGTAAPKSAAGSKSKSYTF
jgi:hypothetical protein